MPYADTDFFLALARDEDWLQERASALLEEHRGDIWTSLPTFIEIAYNAEAYEIDLERAAASILELTDVDVEDQVIFQAYAHIDEGLGVMDAFHAAAAGTDTIISSDDAYDAVGMTRIPLDPHDD